MGARHGEEGGNHSKTLRSEKVKLEIAGSKVIVDLVAKTLYVRALRLILRCEFPPDFAEVRSIQFDKEFTYINLELKPKGKINVSQRIGVDTTIVGGLIVGWIPTSGEFLQLGEEYYELARRYNDFQAAERAANKTAFFKRLTKRRNRRLNDLLRKVRTTIVQTALQRGCGNIFQALE